MHIYNGTIGLLAPLYSPNFGQHDLVIPNEQRRALTDLPRFRGDDWLSVRKGSTFEILGLRYGGYSSTENPERATFSPESAFSLTPYYEMRSFDGRTRGFHDNYNDLDLSPGSSFYIPARLADSVFHNLGISSKRTTDIRIAA